MHQYFANVPLQVGDDYELTKEQAHHADTVLRLNHETVRVVSDGTGYFGQIEKVGKKMVVHIESKDEKRRELPFDVTLAMALIRREKLELVLLKAAELGATRVVLFESSRCVVHAKKEKTERQSERWKNILAEGSAQCKRDRIPELVAVEPFKNLDQYLSEQNFIAYENVDAKSDYLSDHVGKQSVTIVIGPEGGFSEAEVAHLQSIGCMPVTLGSRILRAETAALYALSVIGEQMERNHEI